MPGLSPALPEVTSRGGVDDGLGALPPPSTCGLSWALDPSRYRQAPPPFVHGNGPKGPLSKMALLTSFRVSGEGIRLPQGETLELPRWAPYIQHGADILKKKIKQNKGKVLSQGFCTQAASLAPAESRAQLDAAQERHQGERVRRERPPSLARR